MNQRLATALRLTLALAYPLLAHVAASHHDGSFAAFALADIALIVLLRPLLQARAWAWLAFVAIAAVLAWLVRSGLALQPLMLVPVAIVGGVAWMFGRTLRDVPLITRMVAGLDGIPPGSCRRTCSVTRATSLFRGRCCWRRWRCSTCCWHCWRCPTGCSPAMA
jgi:hypothetical protein